MKKSNLGLIGLAVMGQNLVLNFASHGFSVSVYNRSAKKTEEFMRGDAKKFEITPCFSLAEFVDSLEKPRKIMLMVQAGAPVDAVIEQLIPLVEKGDLIIDGGNSFYEDTVRREARLKELGIHFSGTGISGGEEGALKGASIMPGGDDEAWEMEKPFLTAAAAIAEGEPCTVHIGPGGAGHFVKMTHNGIEYADIQLINEAYMIMRDLLGLNAQDIHDVFSDWNKGELNSYLIEITENIFTKKDDKGEGYLVDKILDTAGQKGTGIWTSIAALNLGVCAPTVTESVYARVISAARDERLYFSKLIDAPKSNESIDREKILSAAKNALYLSKICAYAQGFELLAAASREYDWGLDLGKIALIWRGGCIIRAQFLNRISEAYKRNPELQNIIEDEYFLTSINAHMEDLRYIVSLCANTGVSVPCFSSALSYLDSLRCARLGANLLQAQRDYFGAHTYKRIDMDGVFHTEWINK